MLPVLAEIRTDELFASFVSRTARANGISGLEDLLLDLSVNPSDFHSGKVNAIKRVAEVVGVDTEDALRLSFRKVGKERFSISGQEFSDWYLKRSLYRVCPACIRQDIGPDLTSKTFTRPNARIVWAVTTAHSCPLHRLLLVNPPEPGPAHEFHQTWEPWLLEIFEGDLDSQTASEGAPPATMWNVFTPKPSGYGSRGDDRGYRVLPETTEEEHANHAFEPEPFYWVDLLSVESRLEGRTAREWLVGWKDVTSATNERTAIFSVIPRVAVGHSMPLLFCDREPASFMPCGSKPGSVMLRKLPISIR